MKRIYITVLLLAALVTACELPDNLDPKAPTSVPTSTLVTNAQVALANTIDAISVNTNINRMLCQYTTEVTYVEGARYIFSDRQIPDNYWDNYYRDVLMDLKEAKMLYAELSGSDAFNKQRDNQIAILDILEVYTYQVLVDTYGDVPYSEALMGIENSSPVYDDAASIYNDLFSRLAADLTQLKANASAGSFGPEDVYFGGDVDMWIKAAASLQMRMGLRVADVNASLAKSNVEAAIATGLLEEGDSWELVYPGVTPHVNVIYNAFIVGQRKDYVPCNTLIDHMNALNDPRLPLYATLAPDTNVYIGMPYGLEGGAAYQSYSHFSDQMFDASFPAVFLDYAEVQLLLCEAAERGFTTPMSAEEHYNAGVTASIVSWGGDAADAVTYLAADAPYDAANWKESLGMQIWLANYNRGNEGWNQFRKFDWPPMTPAENMSVLDIPMRWPYPFNEIDLNGDNYEAAASAIGGDDVRTLLFWDVAANTQ